MINCIDQFFQGINVTMFVNNDTFVIHKSDQSCHSLPTESSKPLLMTTVHDFIKSMYPKQKFLFLVFNLLVNQKLINDDLYFIPFPKIHIADFCSFINNKFGKINTTDQRFIKLCKHFQGLNLKFPKVSIKNTVAQKYLC
jgi:hypothetical protein